VKKAKSRTAFSQEQLQILHHRFQSQKYLSPQQIRELAAALGLTYKQVNILLWTAEAHPWCAVILRSRGGFLGVFCWVLVFFCLRHQRCGGFFHGLVYKVGYMREQRV